MNKYGYKNLAFLLMFFNGITYADIVIKSPENSSLHFTHEKKGKNYDPYAWGKIIFTKKGSSADLSRSDRYYTEDGSTKLSPSGKYLLVTSISGAEVGQEDGTLKYIDKAYCSVIDMSSGCIVSDWDGEACGYAWVGNKDVLASSNDPGADTFDFNSMRPIVNEARNSRASTDAIENLMRCDLPNKDNINDYPYLSKINKADENKVDRYIEIYLNTITKESKVMSKSYLFPSPQTSNFKNAYLVPGDRVKVIQLSPDRKWVNIGYINAKGTPLVAWVLADSLQM